MTRRRSYLRILGENLAAFIAVLGALLLAGGVLYVLDAAFGDVGFYVGLFALVIFVWTTIEWAMHR